MVNKNKLGLTIGSLAAFWHLIWSIMVASGAAQTFINWILGLHFLGNRPVIGSFAFGTALALLAATFFLGYIFGWVLGLIWNRVNS